MGNARRTRRTAAREGVAIGTRVWFTRDHLGASRRDELWAVVDESRYNVGESGTVAFAHPNPKLAREGWIYVEVPSKEPGDPPGSTLFVGVAPSMFRTTEKEPTRTFDVQFTISVRGTEDGEQIVEECITTLIDDEIAEHDRGATRCGVSLCDAGRFVVSLVQDSKADPAIATGSTTQADDAGPAEELIGRARNLADRWLHEAHGLANETSDLLRALCERAAGGAP